VVHRLEVGEAVTFQAESRHDRSNERRTGPRGKWQPKIGSDFYGYNRRKIRKTFAVQSFRDEKDCICWDKFVTKAEAARGTLCYSGAWL
jgi:hypothetical protein